jgi:hypothetical protein
MCTLSRIYDEYTSGVKFLSMPVIQLSSRLFNPHGITEFLAHWKFRQNHTVFSQNVYFLAFLGFSAAYFFKAQDSHKEMDSYQNRPQIIND